MCRGSADAAAAGRCDGASGHGEATTLRTCLIIHSEQHRKEGTVTRTSHQYCRFMTSTTLLCNWFT